MIWFYARGSDTLKIETRFNSDTSAYELIWDYPDGTRTVETFSSEALFRQRAQAVESTLTHEQWSLSGSPAIMPDGWKPG
jgi:hypothetical protein